MIVFYHNKLFNLYNNFIFLNSILFDNLFFTNCKRQYEKEFPGKDY
jgi:hypothetical protein